MGLGKECGVYDIANNLVRLTSWISFVARIRELNQGLIFTKLFNLDDVWVLGPLHLDEVFLKQYSKLWGFDSCYRRQTFKKKGDHKKKHFYLFILNLFESHWFNQWVNAYSLLNGLLCFFPLAVHNFDPVIAGTLWWSCYDGILLLSHLLEIQWSKFFSETIRNVVIKANKKWLYFG